MTLLRVNSFSVSLDGFGAGPNQGLENPMGIGGMRVHDWVFPTKTFQHMLGKDGGATGVDDDFAARGFKNLGAWILGRNMFGPIRGPWPDDTWKGWWGDTPPFHTPVFVLTHHHRPSFTLADSTFHFVDATPAEALRQAKDAAEGKDIRVGGGVATVREFLEAGLIDTIHVAVAPIVIGSGERLWRSHEDLLERYHIESVPSPSGVTHLLFWRR